MKYGDRAGILMKVHMKTTLLKKYGGKTNYPICI